MLLSKCRPRAERFTIYVSSPWTNLDQKMLVTCEKNLNSFTGLNPWFYIYRPPTAKVMFLLCVSVHRGDRGQGWGGGAGAREVVGGWGWDGGPAQSPPKKLKTFWIILRLFFPKFLSCVGDCLGRPWRRGVRAVRLLQSRRRTFLFSGLFHQFWCFTCNYFWIIFLRQHWSQ